MLTLINRNKAVTRSTSYVVWQDGRIHVCKVCIWVKWPIRQELILVSVAWSDYIAGLPSCIKFAHVYPIFHLGGERHYGSTVSCPKTQHNVPSQDSSLDCSIWRPPCLYTTYTGYPCFNGEQGWSSGKSARLSPMCPEFDSQTWCHMWVEFVVGSHPCSECFSPRVGSSVFLPPQKSTFSNSNSIRNLRATGLSVEDCYVLPSLNKVDLIYLFNGLAK